MKRTHLTIIKKSGYTFAELMVVMVILGVLSTIGIPTYRMSVEKARSAEGMNILTAVLGSQKRWALENGAYTTIFANLDITTTSTNFGVPPALSAPPVNSGAVVASITRSANPFGNYTLSINENGIITCTNGGVGGTCARLNCTGSCN